MAPDSDLAEAISAFERGDVDVARRLAERAVDSAASAPALHLLGLIECRSGRLEAGVGWLRRALELEPANLQFRVMLARALVDMGRSEGALQVAQRPNGRSPADLALWHVRAEAADLAGEWEASAEAWRTLGEARPGDWRAWAGVGNALIALQRLPEAVVAIHRAVELNPADLPLRRGLATLLARTGRYQESADELGRWVEASPPSAATRVMFARLLADLNRPDDSKAQLDKAAELAGKPGFTDSVETLAAIAGLDAEDTPGAVRIDAVREVAQLLERTNRTEALDRFLVAVGGHGIQPDQIGYPAAAAALRQGDADKAERLLANQLPETDPIRWHSLMARIADAQGDAARAFAEAEAMNRSVADYDSWRARGAKHLQFVRDLAQTITPEWAAKLKTLIPGDRRGPAFLVGFPRSGTTLLDTFLAGHPRSRVLEEIPVVNASQRVLGDVADLPDRSIADLDRARSAYYQALAGHAEIASGDLVIDKLPLNILALPFIRGMFPNAPIVFAQRHPCDAVLSAFMQGFALNDSMASFLDLETAAQYYDAVMSVWSRCRDLLSLHTHTLVYEQLVADPEGALRPLIAFLGLDWRDELLDHRATAKARDDIGTPSYNQIIQPLSRMASGRWRKYENQLRPVLPTLLPWAKQLGYEN